MKIIIKENKANYISAEQKAALKQLRLLKDGEYAEVDNVIIAYRVAGRFRSNSKILITKVGSEILGLNDCKYKFSADNKSLFIFNSSIANIFKKQMNLERSTRSYYTFQVDIFEFDVSNFDIKKIDSFLKYFPIHKVRNNIAALIYCAQKRNDFLGFKISRERKAAAIAATDYAYYRLSDEYQKNHRDQENAKKIVFWLKKNFETMQAEKVVENFNIRKAMLHFLFFKEYVSIGSQMGLDFLETIGEL